MRTSLLFAVLMFAACTDDSEAPTTSIPGPVVGRQICEDRCSTDLEAQLADRDFEQVALPKYDGIVFVEATGLVEADVCSRIPPTGDCLQLCQQASLVAGGCRVLSCELTDGRLLVGQTCR